MAAPGAYGVAAAVPGAWTQAAMLAKTKGGGSISPESASTKREAIREAVAKDVQRENWKAAADETESNAALLGDPISYQEAARFRFEQAAADRDIAAAQAAIETATVALDILHFYEAVDAGEVHSDWLVIDPATASSLVSETEDFISRCETLIEEIEEEAESDEGAATPAATKEKRTREKKPGLALIVSGSVLTGVGAGGLGMFTAFTVISARKQKEVESLVLPDDQAEVERLDEEGSRANLLAYVGAGIGVVGLAAGVALIVVGVKKRKEGAGPPASARLQVAPAIGSRFGGLSLRGRF